MNRYTHDDATYEVIMRKSRASLEPFWGLSISKYLTHVSSEHITSWVLLSMTSTAGETSHVLLAYIMLWINIASLALYIARITVTRGWPARDCSSVTNLKSSSEGILCCWVRLCDWSIETCRYQGWESILDAISMISGASIGSMCTHSIDDLLPHAPLHYAATGEMVKGSL